MYNKALAPLITVWSFLKNPPVVRKKKTVFRDLYIPMCWRMPKLHSAGKIAMD
jgi:hypothetical protein